MRGTAERDVFWAELCKYSVNQENYSIDVYAILPSIHTDSGKL